MIWIIGILTGIMILNCLFLLLLILVQLPKKEAGLGQAFGGATTDALFGAGSGNALTKMTKYSTAVFLVLTLTLSILNAHNKAPESKLKKAYGNLKTETAIPVSGTPAPAVASNVTAGTTQPEAAATNVPKPAVTATNTPAAATPAPETTAGTNAPSASQPK